MIIRSFMGETVAAALKDVRTQMGGEAVVLKTKQVTTPDGRSCFEVTACLDNPTAAQASRALPDRKAAAQAIAPNNRLAGVIDDIPQPETPREAAETPTGQPAAAQGVSAALPSADLERFGHQLDAVQEKLERMMAAADLTSLGVNDELAAIGSAARMLRNADVPEFYIRDLFTSLRAALTGAAITPEIIQSALRDRLAIALGAGVELKPGDRVLVMGSAGAGKTSIIGKLASSLMTERNIPVRLVSLDSIKVGALDEIQSLGDILGVEVADPSMMVDLAQAAQRVEDAERVVLIDSGAMPTDPEKFEQMQVAVDAVAPTHRLAVISALTRSRDVERQARAIMALQPTHTVATMLDLTDSWGAVLGATAVTDTRLALTTASPSGAGTLRPPSSDAFIDRLLGVTEQAETSSDSDIQGGVAREVQHG